jgi:hypothetical protein
MRVYFEKPRTTVGWKGLVMDPHLDGSHDIAAGLRLGRTFLRDVLDLGLPTATEFLDPITPQYVADLVCWGAIGARTTESQTHRQMASGLSMPLGFKNGTDGSITTAINAIKAAGAAPDLPRHQPRRLRLRHRHARQSRLSRRPPRRRRARTTRRPHRRDRGPPRQGRPAEVCPGRLLARQFRQATRAPARGHARPARPRSPRQHLHHGRHDRKQPRRRQPVLPAAQGPAEATA